MSLKGINSCGLALLRGPTDSFDYTLFITDGNITVKVFCHKCVLIAHSERMRINIRGEHFFDMDIKVKPGYITAFIELVQYMYLKDPTLITKESKILELCGMLHMKLDHFLIRSEKLVKQNEYPTVTINFSGATMQSCKLEKSFSSLISSKDVYIDMNAKIREYNTSFD